MINYYKILGLDPISTLEEINEAIKKVRKQARKRSNHPDTKVRHEAELLIEQLSEAEKIFQDETSKNNYDSELKNFKSINDESYDSESNGPISNETANLFAKIEKFLNRGQLDLAKRALDDIKTNDPILMKYKGDIYLKLGNVTEGMYELDKYIDTNSKNPDLYFEVSDILSENGYTNEAINYLYDAEEITRGYSLYSRMALIYANSKQYDKAIETFKKINTNELDSVDLSYVYYGISFCYNRKKDYNNAIEYSNKAIEIDEENSNAIYEKILAYDEVGRLIEIEDLVEHSYIKFPNNDSFNFFVLKVRVLKGSKDMTKIRSNGLTILSSINNLDYIVASKEDIIRAEAMYNSILPLEKFDDSGIVSEELKYLENQISYAKSTVKYSIGNLKWLFILSAVYSFFKLISKSGLGVKLYYIILMSIWILGYIKLTNVPGYYVNKKNNKERIVKL